MPPAQHTFNNPSCNEPLECQITAQRAAPKQIAFHCTCQAGNTFLQELAKERKTTKKGPGIHYVFTVEACYCDKCIECVTPLYHFLKYLRIYPLPEKAGYESQPGKLTAKRARAAKGGLAGAGPGLEELLLPS
jgi:hypothetical protein